MIDRVVKINHVNETYINHIENDISFIGFHFYQKVKNIMYGPLILSSRLAGRPSARIDLNGWTYHIARRTNMTSFHKIVLILELRSVTYGFIV